jgi:hypothetical protein
MLKYLKALLKKLQPKQPPMEKVSKKEFAKATAYLKEHFASKANDRVAFFVNFDTYIDETGTFLYVVEDLGGYYKVSSTVLENMYKSIRYLYITGVEMGSHTVDETIFVLDPMVLTFKDLSQIVDNFNKIKARR